MRAAGKGREVKPSEEGFLRQLAEHIKERRQLEPEGPDWLPFGAMAALAVIAALTAWALGMI